MAHIYIVEDDVNIREIEAFSLKNSGYTVEEFGSAKEFWSRIYEKVPDLIVLDVMLPDEDGLSIVKKLRQWAESRYVPIIMVTAKTTELDRVKGLDRGADDYLTKPFDTKELLARIRAMTRSANANIHADSSMHVGNITLDTASYELSSPSGSYKLANKEYQMMEMMMANPKQLISTERFMEKIWGYDSEAEINVVWVYISYLRKKLEALNADIQIKATRNAGYSLEEKAGIRIDMSR